MKQLTVPFIPELRPDTPLAQVSERLNTLPPQHIAIAPWGCQVAEQVEASFALAHNGNQLLLKYNVREPAVVARYRNTNDPVYKDSCVEFFIAFAGEDAYYNLEANCLGTCLVGYGPGKQNRKLLPIEAIAGIEHLAHLKVANHGQAGKVWDLTLRIPVSVFTEHSLTSFGGLKARGNFYKCGDELPEPHFLTWQTITAPAPDFHRPEQFGSITFQKV